MSLELTIPTLLILLLGLKSCVMDVFSLCLVVVVGCLVQVRLRFCWLPFPLLLGTSTGWPIVELFQCSVFCLSKLLMLLSPVDLKSISKLFIYSGWKKINFWLAQLINNFCKYQKKIFRKYFTSMLYFRGICGAEMKKLFLKHHNHISFILSLHFLDLYY